MFRPALLVSVLLIMQHLAQAQNEPVPASRPAPIGSGLTGEGVAPGAPIKIPLVIAGSLTKANAPFAAVDKLAASVGHRGVLLIQSQARWDAINKLLPDLTPGTPLPKLDFARQNVVMIYDVATLDDFRLSRSDLAATPPELDLLRVYDDRPRKATPPPEAKFLLAVIPAAPAVRVRRIAMPLEASDAGGSEKKVRETIEFAGLLGGKDGGDIVDELQVAIAPKAASVKVGEDLLMGVELHLAQGVDVAAAGPRSVAVWDASFSLGYRNHAFLVSTPEGKTTLLRAAAHDFIKNMPHPVVITDEEPYRLYEGQVEERWRFQSLQALGLETSAPGIYTITALYEETADAKNPAELKGKKVWLWGGSLASNSVRVEVKK